MKEIQAKKKAVIISAQGENTFSLEQRERLKEALDADFRKQENLLKTHEFIELARNAEILAVTKRSIRDFSREIIEALPELKGLAIYATGYEWVDLDALAERNIKLKYLPDYSAITVAEHTMGLLLAMSRRIHLSFDKVRGYVPESTSLRGWELADKKTGIIGFGTIARKFASMLKGFGTEIFYYDKREVETDLAVPMGFDELLGKCDVVVLLNSQTRGNGPVIGVKEISKMKKGAYLVNSSRPGLVDNAAVADAIRRKQLAGYAVDDRIDLFLDKTIEPGRILQTGHTAWYSDEAIARGTEQWVENIISLA